MDFATRITAAVSTSAGLGAIAFALCALGGGELPLIMGAVALLGSLAAAAFALREAHRMGQKVVTLRKRTDAAAHATSQAAGAIPTVAAQDEVDELQNSIARVVASAQEPLDALSAAASSIAQGDLTVELRNEQGGTSGDIIQKFGQMRDSLKELVGDVQANSLDVTSSAEELSAAIEEISSSIQEVSATIAGVSQGASDQSEQVARASHALRQTAEQLQRTAKEVRDAVEQVRQTDESSVEGAKVATDASRRIEQMTRRVDETAEVVRGFADSIGQVSEFVKLIVRISDQTNLLALNAAIEAARAGEHGRGFTVVADEVRKLAEESAKGAEEVQRVIRHITSESDKMVGTMEEMTSEVKEGDAVVRQAIGKFADITQQVSGINTRVTKMATSVDEMAARGNEIAANVESISATAEETAASAEQVSAAVEEQTASIEQVGSTSQNLARNASEALEGVRRFRTGHAPAAKPPGRGSPEIAPVFRPPTSTAAARNRVPLTKYSEEQNRDWRSR